MRKKKKLAVLAGCMLLYFSFMPVALADEADSNSSAAEEVEVTAARFKDLNPVKFTVINAHDIKAMGAQTAADALKNVTGLYITTNNTKGKAIAQFRGSNAENTKIYIDGVPLSPVGDGKVDLSSIPADNIDKIEVIKGAVPVVYGTDAPGGVIFITTKKGGGKSAAALSVTTGSYNTEKIFGSVSGESGKANYYFSAKHDKSDGYTFNDESKGNFYDGKVSWDLSPKSSLTVFGSYSDQQKQMPNRINPATGQIQLNAGQGGVGTARNSFWSNSENWEYDPLKNSYVGALYNQQLSANNDLSFKIYRSNENSDLKAYGWHQDNVPGSDSTIPVWRWLHQYWDGSVKGWELQDTINTSRVNTVTLGYDYELRGFTEQTGRADIATPNQSNYDFTGKSFYIQDITKFNKLSTYFGFRHYDDTDDANITTIAFQSPGPQHGTGTANDPVFSFNYALNDTTNLHGSIGKSFRWPNAQERSAPGGVYGATSGQTVINGTTYYIWPDGSLHQGVVTNYLLPEDAVNRELGVGFEKDGFKFDFTYFYKNISNMIKGQGFGNGYTQYYNIPNVDMHGFEIEVNKKISPQIKGFVNFSYTNAFDTLMKMQVRDIPYRKFSIGLDYAGQDGINADMAVNYIGSCASAFSNGDGNGLGDNPTNQIVQTLPSYTTVDLKVSKTKDNREYYFKILNLFDKYYYSGAYLVAPGRYVEVGTTIKI